MAVAEYLVATRKDAGMPGPQGPAGPAGVTSARGETLPPGSDVEVELHDRVLTVKAPRGDKGDKGDTGATGAQGPKGDTGAQGPKGDKGDAGVAATVRVGAVSTGEPGGEAVVSNSGDEHDAVLDIILPRGATGPQGPKGDTGAQGDTGPRGERGPQGPKGDKGDGLQVDYVAGDVGSLPSAGIAVGDTGLVDGELFAWDGSRWVSQGELQGVPGVGFRSGDGEPSGEAPVGTMYLDYLTGDVYEYER